jgi:hypothetical protein
MAYDSTQEASMKRIVKRTTALAALIAAFAVIAAPAASARFDLNPTTPNDSTKAVAPAPATTVTETSGGFSWGDAAIGAGAMLGLTALGAGALLVVRRSSGRPVYGEAAGAK